MKISVLFVKNTVPYSAKDLVMRLQKKYVRNHETCDYPLDNLLSSGEIGVTILNLVATVQLTEEVGQFQLTGQFLTVIIHVSSGFSRLKF